MNAAANRVGILAEYRESDYRFARQRDDRDYVPLEQSPPPFSGYGAVVLIAIGLSLLTVGAGFMLALSVLTYNIG